MAKTDGLLRRIRRLEKQDGSDHVPFIAICYTQAELDVANEEAKNHKDSLVVRIKTFLPDHLSD